MSVALETPWTTSRFLAWAASQEGRYEFDGFRPVGMTGGTVNHSRIVSNLHAALRSRLRGTPCSFFGPDLGVQAGDAIRYPDALVTCTRQRGEDRLATDVRIVFEVLSPSTASTDRITKVRDYARIRSMRRYVMIESRFPGVTVLYRHAAEEAWLALVLTGEDVLALAEATIELPVAELYEDVAFAAADGSPADV